MRPPVPGLRKLVLELVFYYMKLDWFVTTLLTFCYISLSTTVLFFKKLYEFTCTLVQESLDESKVSQISHRIYFLWYSNEVHVNVIHAGKAAAATQLQAVQKVQGGKVIGNQVQEETMEAVISNTRDVYPNAGSLEVMKRKEEFELSMKPKSIPSPIRGRSDSRCYVMLMSCRPL